MIDHFNKQQWLNYVTDQVSDTDRLEYEEHLYTCEQCLLTYTQCVEEMTSTLPVIENEEDISKQVMNSIQPKETKQKLIHKPLFQYVVAASITMVLMTSGVFQQVAMQQDQFEHETQDKPPVSQELTNKISDFLNDLPTNLRGGQKDE
ncbi:hypothetical protein [Chengkuizengella marina]|uniref:Zinc-finger n=1 Tax=Chengkuizengella marina TaxID=2507566 RepID=A0A6N9Q5Z7_9BACL|nr:hypothetical protein [Chengkuizengella marina]NBI30044.1 hypothetical protein [Chengkuizengella marina]